jgi:hypothetical protein
MESSTIPTTIVVIVLRIGISPRLNMGAPQARLASCPSSVSTARFQKRKEGRESKFRPPEGASAQWVAGSLAAARGVSYSMVFPWPISPVHPTFFFRQRVY